MDFDDILDKYRNSSHSTSDIGTKFEELIARYLMTDPVYASKLEHVWLWKDFFAKGEFGGHDIGIDLVAETAGGGGAQRILGDTVQVLCSRPQSFKE